MRGFSAMLVAVVATGLIVPGSAIAEDPGAVERGAVDLGRTADLNGDGFADLVIGTPWERRGGEYDAGVVNVLYGSVTGLTTDGTQLWTQNSHGVPESIDEEDNFGGGVATADFDADGFADLAVGASGERVGAADHAGVLHVLFGSAAGLTADGTQLWSQDSPDVLDEAEEGDRFGDILATGDLNADGFADLVVGVASDDLGARPNAGAVQVLFGSASGLTAEGNQYWTQGSEGVPDRPEGYDEFGLALAVGRYDGDAFDDLAVGVQLEGLAQQSQGAITVLYGSGAGLTASGSQFWHRDSPGVRGRGKVADRFGHSLAAGDWNGDGRADLAVAVPQGPVTPGGGAVNVLYGSATGLTADGDQLWRQDSPGVKNSTECIPSESNWCDLFGWAVAGADFDGDGADDLAIAVPGEDLALEDQGAVHVIYGSAAGLTARGDRLWSQDSDGIGDRGEFDDRFGWTVFGEDFGNSGQAELVVSAAWEGIGREQAAGLVHVLIGSPDGLTAVGSQRWRQGARGVLEEAEQGDMFGRRLPGSGYPQ
jgi:hypothetical protein